MQQATANMLADMGAQPATLQSGLVAAAPSTDHTPPVSTVTSPAAGAPGARRDRRSTVTGTATDAERRRSPRSRCRSTAAPPGSGRPARPRGASRSCPRRSGPLTITVAGGRRQRATSRRPARPSRSPVAPRAFPASIWHDSTVPGSPATNDANPIEVGRQVPHRRGGLRHRRALLQGRRGTPAPTSATCGAPTAARSSATVTFAGETAGRVAAGPVPHAGRRRPRTRPTSCRTSRPTGTTPATSAYFGGAVRRLAAAGARRRRGRPQRRVPLRLDRLPRHVVRRHQLLGRRRVRHRRPPAPRRSSTAPRPPASTAWRSTPTIQRPLQRGDDRRRRSSSSCATPGGAEVAGARAYDAATRRADVHPDGPARRRDHLHGPGRRRARDRRASPIAAPVEWTFTTTGDADQYPLTRVGHVGHARPRASIDGHAGRSSSACKFRPTSPGCVKGVRFYKGPANSGGHVGHLWTLDGTLLGTATFADESETGWQQADFADAGRRSTAGPDLRRVVLRPGGRLLGHRRRLRRGRRRPRGAPAPPRQRRRAATACSATASSGVPTSSYNDTNYCGRRRRSSSRPTPPARSSSTTPPAIGSSSVATGTIVTGHLRRSPSPRRRSTFTLTGARGRRRRRRSPTTRPPGPPRSPRPAALAEADRYTATVSAADTRGNAMPAPSTWAFTTVTPAGRDARPRSGTARPPRPPRRPTTRSAIEVGLKFRADSDGHVTGIRFYKGPGNIGPHVGHLWRADGTLLATVRLRGRDRVGLAAGQLRHARCPVTAGQTYVVSYHAPAGRYSADADGLLGRRRSTAPPLHALRRRRRRRATACSATAPSGFPTSGYNYAWYGVDVVFVDTGRPDGRGPHPGGRRHRRARSTPRSRPRSASRSTPARLTVDAARRHRRRQTVGGTWAYDAASRTATLRRPRRAPGHGRTRTPRRSRRAVDQAGNPMASRAQPGRSRPSSTARCARCGRPATVPAVAGRQRRRRPIEVGIKFRVDVAGRVVGVRFHKGPGNTGTHVGQPVTGPTAPCSAR